MMIFKLFIVIIILILFGENEAANILAVFPMPSISHQVAFRPLTHELARRGHEVTVITTDPAFPKGEAPKNLREIDVHDAAYNLWNKNLVSFSTGNRKDQINMSLELFSSIFEEELQTPEVQELIKNRNETFDLLILELCVPSTLGLTHIFKAPVILASSFGGIPHVYDSVGASSHPIIYSTTMTFKINKKTMLDKFIDLFIYLYAYSMLWNMELSNNAMLKKYLGEDTPTLTELSENVHMIFLNVHPIWEDNRPVPPNVIYMGGIHQLPPKELPKDLQSYLDSSKHGVIFFSLGTNVRSSSLPTEKLQTIMKVFSKLPYDFLWKWDDDEMPDKPINVRTGKWLPQSDLLRHPKVKLFITQGGIQSTDEAITAGVPLLGIPMLADQWFNVERYVQLKIGVRLDLDDISEESLNNAINTLIGDEREFNETQFSCSVLDSNAIIFITHTHSGMNFLPWRFFGPMTFPSENGKIYFSFCLPLPHTNLDSVQYLNYRRNIEKLRDVLHDQPQRPLERAVWWTEHVLRHGGAKHLRSPAANMPWTQYYEIQLILLLLAGFLAAVSVVVFIVYTLWKYSKKYVTNPKVKTS